MTEADAVRIQEDEPFNPFGVAQPTQLAELTPGQVSHYAREQYELQARMVHAMQWPRNEAKCFVDIINSCKRPGLAKVAEYAYNRGDGLVVGPSVYLMREMARIWGRIDFGFRVVNSTKEFVHIQAYALDLQTGAKESLEDLIERKVQRKNRRTNVTEWVEPDERDLRELVNRRAAIAIRNCIRHIMPRDLVDDAIAESRNTKTLEAEGKLAKNRPQAIKDLVRGFDAYGVTPDQLAEFLGHPIDQITPEEFAEFGAIVAALKSGEARISEYFGGERPPAPPVDENGERKKGNAAIKQALRNKKNQGRSAADAPSDAKRGAEAPRARPDGVLTQTAERPVSTSSRPAAKPDAAESDPEPVAQDAGRQVTPPPPHEPTRYIDTIEERVKTLIEWADNERGRSEKFLLGEARNRFGRASLTTCTHAEIDELFKVLEELPR